MIRTTLICTGIQEVPSAGASAWDGDTRDGEWDSLMEIHIVPIMDMAVGMIHGIHGEATTVDTIPIGVTAVHTGMDIIMASIVDTITEITGTIITIITVTAGSAAGIQWDIQAGPM